MQDCSMSIANALEILQQIDGLMQDCSMSIANALEILQQIDGLMQDCSTSIADALDILQHIDNLMQDCNISIANALEILKSCTKPSIYWLYTLHSFLHIVHFLYCYFFIICVTRQFLFQYIFGSFFHHAINRCVVTMFSIPTIMKLA